VILVALLLAGCGGSSSAPPSKTIPIAGPAAGRGAAAKTLYRGGDWAVVLHGSTAVAVHLVGSTWQADHSRAVRIRILGPQGKVSTIPQVAAELSAHSPLVESGLWVDGHELLEKGGGLTANKGTIYGATDHPLARGRHTAVAYGRTASSGTAVAWSFRVV